MSDAPHDAPVRQERDVMSAGFVYAGATALVVLVVGGWVLSVIVGGGPTASPGWRDDPSVTVAPREINMIDQSLFAAHEPSLGNWDAKARELNSYGWVNRERGIVRIPVSRAMQIIVDRSHAR
jgi:hypothetical protein